MINFSSFSWKRPEGLKKHSEIFSDLFGCHQQLLLDITGRRRAFGVKSQFEMTDDITLTKVAMILTFFVLATAISYGLILHWTYS